MAEMDWKHIRARCLPCLHYLDDVGYPGVWKGGLQKKLRPTKGWILPVNQKTVKSVLLRMNMERTLSRPLNEFLWLQRESFGQVERHWLTNRYLMAIHLTKRKQGQHCGSAMLPVSQFAQAPATAGSKIVLYITPPEAQD